MCDSPLLFTVPHAEVPCAHVVQLARAEVSHNPSAAGPVRAFAQISDSNAEEGCHKLFKRLGLSAPVEVNRFGLGDGPLKNVPYIKLSSWVKWLFNTHRLHRQMVGVATEEQMELVLGEWWKRALSRSPGLWDGLRYEAHHTFLQPLG